MSSNGSFPALHVQDLTFGYEREPVLRGVNLTLAPGDAAAVIGPNGSGKTTLISTMNGLLRPRSGSVSLFGRDVQQLRAKDIARMVACVPQEFRVPFAYRVREIVALGRSPYVGMLRALTAADHRAIDDAMAQTDTDWLQAREYNDLSGGERQRVAVALALAQNPRLLLLDEPTAHLDLAHQIELLQLVRTIIRERGVTVLASMHDVNLAAAFFPRLLVLQQGVIVADGPPADVVRPELLERVFGVDADVVIDPFSGAPRVVPKVNTSTAR